jgi:hypothetical protein
VNVAASRAVVNTGKCAIPRYRFRAKTDKIVEAV